MRSRRRSVEVYSLSAIDLFASAMGAFIIISIIMMPDYQKEVRSQGDLEYLEQLAGQTEALLQETGVACVPGEAFGTPGFLRLNFSVDDEVLAAGAELLRNWFSSR